MTYDPRKGTSSYLGMDDGLLEDELPEDFEQQSTPRSRQQRRTGPQASAQAPRRQPTGGRGERLIRTPRGDADQVPATTLRPTQAPRRGVAPVTPVYARSESSREPVRPVPAPRPDRYEPAPSPVPGAVRSRVAGPLVSFEAFLLHLIALALRVVAIVLAFLVVASVFLSGSMRQTMLEAMRLTSLLVPPSLLGRFVYETPFGGVLRGDLALASMILFLADWACLRVSHAVRERHEGRA